MHSSSGRYSGSLVGERLEVILRRAVLCQMPKGKETLSGRVRIGVTFQGEGQL